MNHVGKRSKIGNWQNVALSHRVLANCRVVAFWRRQIPIFFFYMIKKRRFYVHFMIAQCYKLAISPIGDAKT
jgi:hypothetical protein